MYKKFTSILLSCVLILSIFTCSAFAGTETKESSDKVTLATLEQELNSFIQEKHPEITIGSSDYVNYLTDQLMFDADQQLANLSNYEDLMFYASRFLAEANNPNATEVSKLTDGTEIIKLKKTITQMEAEKLRRQLQEENRLEEIAVASQLSDVSPLATTYSPSAAVAYAQKYAKSYNTPAYKAFTSDCTNFVSQCLAAGGKSMTKPSNYKNLGTYKTTSYWYSMHWTDISPYHRYGISSSFIGVADFYTYWKTRGGLLISGLSKSQLQSQAKKGDIVQLKRSDGWYHSIIITSGSKGAWKYCGHSNDKKDALIADITGATEYRILRFA